MNSPQEIVKITEQMAENKFKTPVIKTAILGILAGIYIAMGGLLSLLAGYGMPGLTLENPGLQRLLSGITFPLGLILVVMVGAELFTGNNANLIPAAFNKKIPPYYIFKNWTVVFFSNFAGAVLFVYFMIHLPGIVSDSPWHPAIIKIAETKVNAPWHVVFLKGIGANWLVCLAVWLGLSAKDSLGRMFGLWWPVMAFVVMGFEHSIANMFYIPLGIFCGAEITWTEFVSDNLIPAAIGNIIGGAGFVGSIYWYIYGKDSARR